MRPSTALTMELGDQAAAALADNNNVSTDTVSSDEMELLRKLEEANR